MVNADSAGNGSSGDVQIGALRVERVVRVGDLLTSLSLIITLVSLLVAWSQERAAHDREQADRVRRGAALTLAKLERSQELASWFYDDVQPLFVRASEMLAERRNIAAARDYLWAGLNEARARTLNRLHEEQVEQAYVELYGYYPDAYRIVKNAIDSLRSHDEAAFNGLLAATQQDIFFFDPDGDGRPAAAFQSAELGNRLRASAARFETRLLAEHDGSLQPAREFILRVIEARDQELLRRAGDRRP